MGTEYKVIKIETNFATLVLRELLKAPWIDYPEALARLELTMNGTVFDLSKHYGIIQSDNADSFHTWLTVDYDKYKQACEELGVKPASVETIQSHGTSKKSVYGDRSS